MSNNLLRGLAYGIPISLILWAGIIFTAVQVFGDDYSAYAVRVTVNPDLHDGPTPATAYMGYVLTTAAKITEPVPASITDIEVTWAEYLPSYQTSLDGGMVMFEVGERDANGNRRDIVGRDEFVLWYGYWAANDATVLTQAGYADMLRAYFTPDEPEGM